MKIVTINSTIMIFLDQKLIKTEKNKCFFKQINAVLIVTYLLLIR